MGLAGQAPGLGVPGLDHWPEGHHFPGPQQGDSWQKQPGCLGSRKPSTLANGGNYTVFGKGHSSVIFLGSDLAGIELVWMVVAW